MCPQTFQPHIGPRKGLISRQLRPGIPWPRDHQIRPREFTQCCCDAHPEYHWGTAPSTTGRSASDSRQTSDILHAGLTIGNAEVSLLELTNAYATLARLGTFKSARLILDEKASRHDSQINQIAAPTHCYMISDILSDNAARLAAFGPHSPLRLPFRVAVKTGTSSDFRDNWCIGFTGDFTVGSGSETSITAPCAGSPAWWSKPHFQANVLALHENRTPKWLKRPDGLAGITIDTRTGHRFLSKPRDGHPSLQRTMSLRQAS